MRTDKNEKNDFSDTDLFWDLELLLPKIEKKAYLQSTYDTSTNDFKSDFSQTENSPKSEKIPKREPTDSFPPITKAPKAQTSSFDAWLEERKRHERSRGLHGKRVAQAYVPESRLIKKVTISVDELPTRTGERFLTDAHRMKGLEAEFKGNVPFESYYPQYSQMNAEQTACYIGFRSEVRLGRYPRVDKAYIYLYLYELINLTENPPDKRANVICGLINGYPDCEARLFADMCNWLCDICLIYNVTLPDGVFGDNIFRVIECASVKEFFIKTERGFDAGIAFLLTCGKYDFRKSRFYPENKLYYDKYINSAVGYALKEIAKTDSRFSGADETLCTLSHESYFGALCTPAVRRTVSLECVCVTRSESVRDTVTELTKYAENTLRKRLGVTPQLTVNGLNLERKELIKVYFERISGELPISKKRFKKLKESTLNEQKVPEYEYLYEPKTTGVSFEQAVEIEKASWQITRKLITEAELDEPEEAKFIPENAKTIEMPKTDKNSFLREAMRVLITHGSAEYIKFVRSNGKFADSVADEINEIMYERVSDVAIIIGDEYEAVSDYQAEIQDFIAGR